MKFLDFFLNLITAGPLHERLYFIFGVIWFFGGIFFVGILFPLIFYVKIIPGIEKKINKNPMYIKTNIYPRYIGKIPRVMWHIIMKYWLSRNENALFGIIKRWSGFIDRRFQDDLMLYKPSFFSRFELVVSFLLLMTIWFCVLSLIISCSIIYFYKI